MSVIEKILTMEEKVTTSKKLSQHTLLQFTIYDCEFIGFRTTRLQANKHDDVDFPVVISNVIFWSRNLYSPDGVILRLFRWLLNINYIIEVIKPPVGGVSFSVTACGVEFWHSHHSSVRFPGIPQNLINFIQVRTMLL